MDQRLLIIAIAAILALAAGVWAGFALGWWQGLAVWLIGVGLVLAVALLAREES